MADMFLGVARVTYHLKKKDGAKKKAIVRSLLDETFGTIPDAARNSIIRHWSQSPAIIEFRDHVIPGFKPRTGGQTRDRGRLIIYRHDYLLNMPQTLAKALIAHEFAHAFVCSSVDELRRIKGMAEKDLRCKIPFDGTWDQFGLDPDSAVSDFRVVAGILIFRESYFINLNEERVRQINREWGFDENALSE